MLNVWGTEQVHNGYWWGVLRKREHVKILDVDERIIFKLLLKKWDGEAWTGWIWLRTGTVGGRL
jgi:hypothetical protein